MTRPEGKAENQHYVPKMLLKHFAVDPRAKTSRIHVFDKKSAKLIPGPTNIENVAAERSFYDLKDSTSRLSIEPSLTELEGHANTALEKIRSQGLKALRPGDIWWLATFVAAQRVRGRAFREAMLQFEHDLVKRVEEIGFDPAKMEKRPQTREDIKLSTIANLFKNVASIAPLIVELDWVLFTTTHEAPFWISDNPLTMFNSTDQSIFGGIGFASNGVEVYLPISPLITLAFWCPSMRAMIKRAVNTARGFLAADDLLSSFPNTIGGAIEHAHLRVAAEQMISTREPRLVALENRGSIACSRNNVDFLNAQQVSWAERFVMSSTADFSVAENMIAKYPELQRGGVRLVLEPIGGALKRK